MDSEEGRIDGALKLEGSNVWMIPDDFELYPKTEKKGESNQLSSSR